MHSIISDADLRAIKEVANRNSREINFLQKILQKSTIIKDKMLPKKTIRLNSLVLLWHSILKKAVKIRIVLPHKADLKKRNISVFAPISMAILGFKENDRINVRLGGIAKELRIIKVINQ
jgi:regulator of nucleoside diphosphate kinase